MKNICCIHYERENIRDDRGENGEARDSQILLYRTIENRVGNSPSHVHGEDNLKSLNYKYSTSLVVTVTVDLEKKNCSTPSHRKTKLVMSDIKCVDSKITANAGKTPRNRLNRG